MNLFVFRKYFLFVILSCAMNANSQSIYDVEYAKTEFDTALINPITWYKKIYSKLPEKLLSKKMQDEFVGNMSEYFAYNHSYSKIILDKPKYEQYLNDILAKIVSEQEIANNNLHVYLVEDNEVNATAFNDGTIYFNYGLIAELQDEAQVASVLGHEAQHRIANHGAKSFKKLKKAQDDIFVSQFLGLYGIFSAFSIKNNFYRNSRQDERECDSESLNRLLNAGYDIEAAVRLEGNFIRLENTYNHKEKSHWLYRTHPHSEDRLKDAKAFVAKNKSQQNQTASKYLVSQEIFNELRNIAINKTIPSFFINNDLNEVLCFAIRKHCIEQSNPLYIHACLETIKRYEFFNKKQMKKTFVTFSGDANVKNAIVTTNNFGFDSLEMKIISAIDLSFLKEFETFQSTYNYFKKKAIETNCVECLLTIATTPSENKDSATAYLNLYKQNSTAKYTSYANHLLDNDISNLPNNKLLVLSSYDYMRNKKTYLENIKSNATKLDALNKKLALRKMMVKTNRILLDENQLNATDKSVLALTKNVLYGYKMFMRYKSNLFLYDPRIYELLINNNASAIEFVDFGKSPLTSIAYMIYDMTPYRMTIFSFNAKAKKYKVASSLVERGLGITKERRFFRYHRRISHKIDNSHRRKFAFSLVAFLKRRTYKY